MGVDAKLVVVCKGEEYWQGGFVWYLERFNLSMTYDESSKFLQYIIEGFNE